MRKANCLDSLLARKRPKMALQKPPTEVPASRIDRNILGFVAGIYHYMLWCVPASSTSADRVFIADVGGAADAGEKCGRAGSLH